MIDGDTLTQQICSDRDGARTVYAEVTTTFGTPHRHRAGRRSTTDPLPCRIRRSDLDSTGTVSLVKTFELFQEGASSCSSRTTCRRSRPDSSSWARSASTSTRRSRGAVSRTSRVSWISRVGAGSVTIESELADGDALFARGTTFLVGFDLAAQKSRAFSPEERAVSLD